MLPGWFAAVVILFAIGVVYGRSVYAPFIFDDVDGIENNDSIASLWPLVGVGGQPGPLNPPSDLPSAGRPVVNLSLALNYYWGGLKPVGYHVFNVSIHCLVALTLYAIVRRTLLAYFAPRFDGSGSWLALAVALVWALHPLQTEAVVYVTQRSELLVALFYLATLYFSLRYWDSDGGDRFDWRRIWLGLAILASAAGMASKEVMVSAPVMIMLFDRAFVRGSLGSAWRRSWPLYVGLGCTWLVLLALNIDSPRGKSAGFGLGPPLATWWMTQAQVLVMYAKLVVWPSPLLIHYRLPYLEAFSQAWVYVVPVLALAIVTLILLWRNTPTGYLLACVFAILAPTSVVPILTEMAAERRMYLPLAAIAVLFVVGGHRVAKYLFSRRGLSQQRQKVAMLASMVVLVVALGAASVDRLHAYQEPAILWREVVYYQPENALAHGNLGSLYCRSGRLAEGLAALRTAHSLAPDDSMILTNLGQALMDSGAIDEAIAKLTAAIAQRPDDPLALNNLGVALIQAGRAQEAIEPLERTVQLRPRFAMARNSLGGALAATSRNVEAIEQFRQALALDPSLEMARQNLALLLSAQAPAAEATK